MPLRNFIRENKTENNYNTMAWLSAVRGQMCEIKSMLGKDRF
jgi:hypothetical protein